MDQTENHWLKLTLRLLGDRLPLDELSYKLSIQPTKICKAGELMTANPNSATYSTNFWIWDMPITESITLPEALAKMMERLDCESVELERTLRLPGVRGEIFIGYGVEFNSDVILPFSLLQRIASLNLDLRFDIYTVS